MWCVKVQSVLHSHIILMHRVQPYRGAQTIIHTETSGTLPDSRNCISCVDRAVQDRFSELGPQEKLKCNLGSSVMQGCVMQGGELMIRCGARDNCTAASDSVLG